jgi:hypothetical protein
MSKVRPFNANQIPEELLNDKELNQQIKQLPENYNFEIHKTIWRIRTIKAKRGTVDSHICDSSRLRLISSGNANA